MTTSWVQTASAQRVRFGTDALDRVAEAVREVGGRRVLLVTSARRRSSGAGERLVGLLGRAVVSTYEGARPHVPTATVQEAAQQAQGDGVDAVVSFGGGSCIDLAKAVCFFAERQAGVPGAAYVDRPSIAHISVPTTYACAALTPVFEMTEAGTRRKTEAGGPTIAPLGSIHDPVLTLDLPGRDSAETGMGAFGQAVEAALSPASTPDARALALAAATALAEWLPRVVDDPDDLSARTGMLEAAFLAARSRAEGGRGAAHILARLVGGRSGIPHGLAAAILLAPTVAGLAEPAGAAGRRLGAALGDTDDVVGAIDRLRQRVGLPARLGEAGVVADDLDAVVRMAASAFGPVRPPDEQELRAVLDASA